MGVQVNLCTATVYTIIYMLQYLNNDVDRAFQNDIPGIPLLSLMKHCRDRYHMTSHDDHMTGWLTVVSRSRMVL